MLRKTPVSDVLIIVGGAGVSAAFLAALTWCLWTGYPTAWVP